MTNDAFDALLNAKVVFRSRPLTVPADYRPERRIALIMLFVDACHGSTATLGQLHVLDWACGNESSRNIFLNALSGRRSPDVARVRFDPSLDRAVMWACADGLLMPIGKSVQAGRKPTDIQAIRFGLGTKGEVFRDQILSMPACFTTERLLLDEVRPLTKDKVSALINIGEA